MAQQLREHLLVLRRTQVWFPAPVISVPENLKASSGLPQHYTQGAHINMNANAHTNKLKISLKSMKVKG